jgi:hypothetical protein
VPIGPVLNLTETVAMPEQIREMLLMAIRAARHGTPPGPSITQAVTIGDRELSLDRLEFDSLAWMEFCISIELQSGQELTPAHIGRMQYFYEIEDWLGARA